jgi:PKD repeat protein
LSTEDSFKVQVPSGWVIQDVKNRGFTLASEVLQGYGLLAQLCPAEQEVQQQQTLQGEPHPGVDSNTSGNSDGSCQGVHKEVIHILRYPNLAAWIGLSPDDIIRNDDAAASIILEYQMQKLQEAGYRDIRIVNSTDTTINVDIGTGLNNTTTTARLPAKLTELTYTTNLAPDETKRGYFVSTATNVTPRDLGLITGYGIFYEGLVLDATLTEEEEEPQTMIQRSSLLLQPLSPIKQVIDSFELIAGAEILQDIIAAQTQQVTQQEELENTLAVEIDSSDTEGATPATIEFEADITGGSEPYNIMWDIDDDQIADSNEETLVVTISEAGTYNIDLVVADIEGQIASDSVEVTIERGEAPLDEQTSTVQDKEQLTEQMPEEETICDSSYPDTCIPPPPPILNCDEVEASNFEVQPPDSHHFDADNDGVGCETENNELVELDGELDRLGTSDSQDIGGIIDDAIRGFYNSIAT